MQPVITDIKKDNPFWNVIGLAAINTAVSFGRASVRYELIDDATGKLVGEVENTGNARPWNIYPWQVLSDFEPLGHSYIMLNRGAIALRKDVRKIPTRMPHQDSVPSVSVGN